MARLIFLSLLLLLIDLLAFQALRSIVGGSGKTLRTITYAIYWAIPVLTLIYVIGFTTGWSENLPKTLKVTFRALIFILYFSKLLIAVIILVDDLRRLIFGALNLGFKDWKLSTSRSQWMAYIGLMLGAIPILSLTYGMARNPYRYQLLKNRLPIKNLHPDLSFPFRSAL